jgi:aspartokinase/homoserine dehydrogenase 1
MKVLKFGGSSIGSAQRMLNAKEIIESDFDKKLVIVSALNGVTDLLDRVTHLAATTDTDYLSTYNEIEKIHTDIIVDLFKGKKLAQVNQHVHNLLHELKTIVQGIYMLSDASPKVRDKVLSFGERLAAYILFNIIDGSALVNVTDLVKTDSKFGSANVDMGLTYERIKEFLDQNWADVYIVPGFIGTDFYGNITTLGRGGSDYTAAIMASAVKSPSLQIWTDVDGFMTADPKKVPKAFAIEQLSYAEAMELSHFGAEVIYTPTIQPVYKDNIEVEIKNTFNPKATGTLINNTSIKQSDALIKGISSIDNVDLVTVQGPGMVGVKGTSSKLFGSLAENDVNIILITQASSEYSITFAILPKDTEPAVRAIEGTFDTEIFHKRDIDIKVEKDLSIIAIVGEQMKNTPGISANLFSSLGRNGISVIATAQGSSEINISIVVKKNSLKKALNVIHEGFFLSQLKELHLFIVGLGTVGTSLMKQLHQQKENLLSDSHLKLNILGLSNSRKMLIDENGLPSDNYYDYLMENGEKADIHLFIKKMAELNIRNSVFIDVTANDKIGSTYQEVIDSFISVVAANKVACSSSFSSYNMLKTSAKEKKVKFFYETNVGAGLPIISTINSLINSGDKILRIEAVLSGTLNFIFNELSAKTSFSKAVKMAQESGFTEPDPRIDLSGIDVVRKILILSRDAGYRIEQSDVDLEPLLPAESFEGSIDDFWKNLSSNDNEFEKKRKRLQKENKKFRFVASLNEGKASVGLREVGADHPSYHLEGSNNIILITTERYKEHPMIVKGYGAGADVTAAGVFADIIRVANL